MFGVWAAVQPFPTDVVTRDFRIRSHDRTAILLRWFESSGSHPGSAALYLHGGGMLLGSVDVYAEILRRYVSASGVPLLAVDYRLRPGHPYPAPLEDCYAGLGWLADRAQEFGVGPARSPSWGIARVAARRSDRYRGARPRGPGPPYRIGLTGFRNGTVFRGGSAKIT